MWGEFRAFAEGLASVGANVWGDMQFRRVEQVEPLEEDVAAVANLLGRHPAGGFRIAVVDGEGRPVVIENAPFLDDGTPMPTRFWLVGRELSVAIARLEGDGGVRRAERVIDPAHVMDVHRRYAEARDALIPADHQGPVPSGGVGGTRRGVKCLHTHVANHLACGDDPVGAWALDQLAATGALEARASLPSGCS